MWNALKEGLKIKITRANPYHVNPRHCLLNGQSKAVDAQYLQKKQINRNSYLVRFALPDPTKCLGLRIGEFVRVFLPNQKQRPYNAISRIDEPGLVDFLVRDLRKQNGPNSFTSEILSMKEGDKVQLQGPFTQYIYHGYGKLEWENQPLKTYRHIGIVAFESGITGAYNLIDAIMPNYDTVGVSLLWVGQEMDDFIFIQEYSTLSEQLKLNCNLMLRDLKPGWIGPYGPITKAHLQSYMPPAGDDTAILLIGSPKEVAHLNPMLKDLGYSNIMQPIES